MFDKKETHNFVVVWLADVIAMFGSWLIGIVDPYCTKFEVSWDDDEDDWEESL